MIWLSVAKGSYRRGVFGSDESDEGAVNEVNEERENTVPQDGKSKRHIKSRYSITLDLWNRTYGTKIYKKKLLKYINYSIYKCQ